MKNDDTITTKVVWNRADRMAPGDNHIIYVITVDDLIFTSVYFSPNDEYRIYTQSAETNYNLPASKIKGWIPTNLIIDPDCEDDCCREEMN